MSNETHARAHTHTRLLKLMKFEIFQEEAVSARGVLSQQFLRLHVCHCI